MIIIHADVFQVHNDFQQPKKESSILFPSVVVLSFTGKQAVLVLSCDNSHMNDEVMVEPGLVMIFAHGIE